MPVRASIASGNWTVAATWGLVDATSYLNSETGSEILTTAYSGTRSAAFTPGGITISHIAVKLSVRTGTTGTISVNLEKDSDDSQVAGTEVTIDCADLPVAATADLNGGWIFFRLAAPVTLAAATAYQLAAKTSSASQVSLFRDGTTDNIARALITTTTGAPAAGDDLIVAGEYTGQGTSNSFTVTMDETATTDYGAASTSLVTPAIAICSKGTLTYGVTAATAYYLKVSGNVIVYTGGLLNTGTVANPMPSGSSGVLEFDCGTNVDFGLTVRNLGTWVGQGNPITTVWTYLNTDEAAAATVIGVVSSAGWAAGDVLAFAPTTQTASQVEHKTIDTVDSATQVTLTAGLTNARSGTSPTQAEVGNITRNVKIRGISATLQAYIDIKATAIVDLDYLEIYWMGSATTLKRGIDFATITGFLNIQYCALHDFTVTSSIGLNTVGLAADNFTISNNVFYKINNAGLVINATTGTSYTVHNNLFLGSVAAGGIASVKVGGVFTNNTAAGNAGLGILIVEANATIGTISGNTTHSNAAIGFTVQGNGTVSNTTTWRHPTWGLSPIGSEDLFMDGVTIFGNSSRNIILSGTGKLTINNLVSNGDTTFPTAQGIDFNGTQVILEITNGNFSTVSGIKTAHTAADIRFNIHTYVQVVLHNTKLGAATEVSGQDTLMTPGSFIASQKHDQVAGNHKTWMREGTISTDSTIFGTAAPSARMTPLSSTAKLSAKRGSHSGMFHAAVNSGSTLTVSVKVRQSLVATGDSATYNGARARLIVLANPSIGINADTVLATATSASEGAFETLSGTTPAATDDGVMEFIVDCDGTAGWVNVDDFAVTAGAQDTAGLKYWLAGTPLVVDEPAGGGAPYHGAMSGGML